MKQIAITFFILCVLSLLNQSWASAIAFGLLTIVLGAKAK